MYRLQAQLVNGIDPLWVLVERVIANQEKKGKNFATVTVCNPAHLRNTNALGKGCAYVSITCVWIRHLHQAATPLPAPIMLHQGFSLLYFMCVVSSTKESQLL